MAPSPLRPDFRRFFQGERPSDGPVTLSHRRIYIIPNWRGLALALLLLVQWLAAINYSNNLAFILTFLLVAIALLAMIHGFRNLAGLRLRPRKSAPVFAGDQAAFELILENPTPLPRLAIRLKAKNAEPVRLDIPAEDKLSAALKIGAERRGWLDPGTVTVHSEFPLGIFYAWSPLNFKERILVYPQPSADRLPFPVSEGYGKTQRRKQSADDFYGFQAYRPGDPLKRIHWKGLAKGHDPQVKQYSGEEADILHLAFDTTPGADGEARLSRLCRWVLDAEAAGLRYGLDLPGTRLAPGSGAEQRRQCLEALALCEL
jgi:uncharacterized protein (DUF58 family)